MIELRHGSRGCTKPTSKHRSAQQKRLASNRLQQFFFKPASPAPLAALRIGVAATLILQAACCAGQFFEWYGTDGLLQNGIAERFAWGIPQTAQLARWLAPLGISQSAFLSSIAVLYLLGLIALMVGWHTRIAAILAWAGHLILTQQHVTSYGLDLLSHISLFYLIWMPCGRVWSIDALRKKTDGTVLATSLTRLSLRVCQLHLALVYLTSGLEKASGPQWWNGEAIWRSLMLPIYRQWDLHTLAWFPGIAMMAGWATLIVEIGYPVFIFPRKTRRLWLGLTLGMHAGIAVLLGLHLFAVLMACLSFSLFGVESEPENVRYRSWTLFPARRQDRVTPEVAY